MSIRRILICDHKNKCGSIYNESDLVKNSFDKSLYREDEYLIEAARKAGWHTEAAYSFCPSCKIDVFGDSNV